MAEKYHQDLGLEYTKIEGTLFYGFRVEGLRYKDFLHIELFELEYKFWMLFAPIPSISKVNAKGFVFDQRAFEKSYQSQEKEKQSFGVFIQELHVQDLQLHTQEEDIRLDLEASEILYTQKLHIKNFVTKIGSSYGILEGSGRVVNTQIDADLLYTPSRDLKEKYLYFLERSAESIKLQLKLNEEEIFAKTKFDTLSLRSLNDLQIEDVFVDAHYLFKNKELSLEIQNSLQYQDYDAKMQQNVRVFADGSYELGLLLEPNLKNLDIGAIELNLFGKHKRFDAFVRVQEHILELKTKDLQAFSYKVHSPYMFAQGLLEQNDENISLHSSIDLNTTLDIFQNIPLDLQKIQKIDLHIQHNHEQTRLYATTPLARAELLYRHAELRGVLAFGKESLYLSTQDQMQSFVLRCDIESLQEFFDSLGLDLGTNIHLIDAAIKTKTQLRFKDGLCAKSEITIPWYEVTLENQPPYRGKDLSLELSYCGGEILLQNYALEILEHKIFATKPSKIRRDERGDFVLEELYVNDSVKIQGTLFLEKQKAQLHIKSDRFVYEGEDLNASVRLDLDAELGSDGSQKIKGELTLLDGVLSYMPKNDYSIRDKDIIIIEEIQEKQKKKRELDLTLRSAKAIAYEVKNVQLEFLPDLHITQAMGEDLRVKGSVVIERGEVDVSERVFVFDTSTLLFEGLKDPDPQLDIHLHHYTLDNRDIKIYITHLLSDPVILFSSQPAMSQEDILSYILFGESASAVFDASGSADTKASLSALLLGTGLKQLLNQNSIFKVDTLNILTNKEGTLGYEIGARINKKMRLVYKNDTVSSVILQYTLNKNVRIDVDVDETGQGVSIIYVKEFAAP